MSSQNAYPGPNAARPMARPGAPERPSQPAWVQPQAPAQQPAQQLGAGWAQQPAPGYQGQFAQPGYAMPQQGQAQPLPAYGQWSELQPGHPSQQASPPAQADPYAPQFEPYVAPSRAAPAYGQPLQAPQWAQRAPDPRAFDGGGYASPNPQHQPVQQPFQGGGFATERPYQDTDLSSADWAGPTGGFGNDAFQQAQGGADLGFAQADGGELDQAYGDDDEYEIEDAPRGRRPMMILAALLGAILVGGGMAYGFKKFTAGGAGADGDPPLVKSADFPSKTKPADAGGKQFPYADTKILGRLGDGSTSASADDSSAGSASPPAADTSTPSSPTQSDDGGARKVATLVVGRDGTIQAPASTATSDPSASADTGVPGTSLGDVFGATKRQSLGGSAPTGDDSGATAKPNSDSASADDAPSPPKKPVTPAKAAKVNIASAKPATADSADATDAAPPPVKHKKPKKAAHTAEAAVADTTAEAPPVTTSGGSGGYVAVLASVPKSSSSRMDALKRFADMQQKYSSALSGKTPDVAEANLGAKGAYNRLIVGPPGSREEASNVCSQLKTAGYSDCWVTTY